jgi:hypothetical protein
MSRIVSPPQIVVNRAYIGPNAIPVISPAPPSHSTLTSTAGRVNLTPNVDFSWADELIWYITVDSIVGTPSAGTLIAKFQLGTPHTGNAFSTSTFPLSGSMLMDLESSQVTSLIVDGADWPSPIAAYNTSISTPITYKRSIKNFGAFCNLQLDASTLSGGTNPAFRVSVVLVQKGS